MFLKNLVDEGYQILEKVIITNNGDIQELE